MKICNKQYSLTPKGEFYLIGYGSRFESRRNPAKGIHDEIIANVLLLEDKGERIFIFNADYIEFLQAFCDQMKEQLSQKFGIKPQHVLFCATHNHQSVRDYHRTWESGNFNAEYETFLIDTILRSFEECSQELAEVEARFGSRIIESYYGNRNHKGELADNEVIKLEFTKDGKPVAGIINWAVHSTVLSPENNMLTAEFAGNTREEYAKLAGYRPLMIVGAAADCSTRHFNQGTDFAELERVSKGMAQEILNIEATKTLNISYSHDEEVDYTVQYQMSDYYDELNEKLEECIAAQEGKLAWKEPIHPGFYSKCIKNKLNIDTVHIKLFSTILFLGDLVIITIPGELASKFGIELKQLGVAPCTLIFGYTNGFLHYMMPQEEYGLSMESIDSLYPAGTTEVYVKEIKQTLKKAMEENT